MRRPNRHIFHIRIGHIVPNIKSNQCALLIIDVQFRLMPAIEQAEHVITTCGTLIKAATLLDVPVLATEQYPQGLGQTVDGLLPSGVPVVEKTTFDACKTPDFLERLALHKDIVIAGCEAHVCVLQTALSLIRHGKSVYVVVDAVGSRMTQSREIALRRMEAAGVQLVTMEMVLFEWLVDAKHTSFKQVHALLA